MHIFLREFIAAHRTEAILFACSFIVHLAASIFLYATFGDQVLYFENEDALGYMEIAQHVAAGDGFMHNGVLSAVRTPLYPLFLTVILFFRLSMPWAILLLHNFIASAAAVLLYRIGKLFFSERVGLVAGYIYSLEPYMIMTSNLATTETLFNFLVLCFLYAFGKWYLRESSPRLLLWSGFWLGLAMLTRPVALYAPLVVLLLLGFRWLKERNTRVFFLHATLFLAMFFFVLSPWMLRQYARFGTPRLTNIDASMMYFRIAPIVVSAEEGIGYTDAIQRLKERLIAAYPEYTDAQSNTFQYYAFMKDETKKLVAKNPSIVAKYYALSLIPGLTGTGYEYMLEAVFGMKRSAARVSFTELLLKGDAAGYISALSHVDAFRLALLGGAGLWACAYLLIFWVLLRRVNWRIQWPVFAILLLFGGYFIFFSLGPQIHARYRMPSFPFLYLLLAYALIQIYESYFCRHPRIQ